MALGRIGHKKHAVNYRELERINAHYRRFYEDSRADHLSAEELTMWTNRIDKLEHMEDRRAEFLTTPVNKTKHGIVVDLVEMLLRHDPSIRSVIEVGVYWGYVIDHLAGRHPTVSFTGTDIGRDTLAINVEFKRPNLEFRIGYALDMLESCQITGDVVFFNATATRFRINELKRYLRATGRQARYVVFSEPLVHLPGGLVIDPAKLSLKESRPTSLSSEEWPPQYVHNYRALAEQAEFRTLHYRVYEPSFWQGIHRIDLIAEHPRQSGTFV